MRRPWRAWMIYGLCVAIVLAGFGYVTAAALRLEARQHVAERRAAREERIRLALGRMEQQLIALVVREAAYPAYWYGPRYAPELVGLSASERAARSMGAAPLRWRSSPLADAPGDDVVLHFSATADGAVVSPQVADGDGQVATAGDPAGGVKPLAYAERLAELRERLSSNLLAELPPPAAASSDLHVADAGANVVPPDRRQAMTQIHLNAEEFRSRSGNLARAQRSAQEPERSDTTARRGPPVGHWLDDGTLVLASRVEWPRGESPAAGRRLTDGAVLGAWLDWPALRERLLASVADLLPAAELHPVRGGENVAPGRALASLPLRIEPGAVPVVGGDGSPLGTALAAAWAGVAVAVIAAGVMLHGVLALSRRRAAFVSAVSHELRTPLTSLRLHADLAADNRLDAGKRERHLATLCGEAGRLSGLVDNVLEWAGLERRGANHVGAVTVGSLVDEAGRRFGQRAEETGMEIEVDLPAEVAKATVRADPAAVERILFNLVDNACKYASDADDRRIHLDVRAEGRRVAIRVCDHGPGVPMPVRRRLFRPFEKSAREAADTRPGVGLGLALCRRLARRQDGELRLVETAGGGACFELLLRRA